MKFDGWIKPLWLFVAGAVKARLHDLVESISERSLARFKQLLHERIEKL